MDTILFADADGIVEIPANGGATEVLVPRGEGERLHSPQLLPGGKAILFTVVPLEPGTAGGFDTAQVVVQSIGSEDRTVIWEGGSSARYLSTGHLVYAQGTSLYAIPFDADQRAVRGGAVQMLSGLRRSVNGFSDTANLAISDTGTLAYIPGDPNGGAAAPAVETTLTWVDRSGREDPLPVRPDNYTAVRISPDGSRIALVVGQLNPNATVTQTPSIWIYDLDTENLSLLTADPAGDDGPVWSTDGKRVFFRSLRTDSVGIYSIEVGTGETTLIAEATDEVPIPLPWSIAPDDQVLAMVSAASVTDINLATVSLDDGEMAILVGEADPEFEPSISPNGHWLAYQERFAADNPEIDIRPFPGVSRTRIPVGPGQHSLFSHDGTELFYFDGQGLRAASIAYEPTLRVGKPETLFEAPTAYLWNALGRAWDADPSGQRFLLIRRPGAPAPGVEAERERIDIVLNWTEELKTRVPTGGP
jgi:dipeptidyl aminopeptidase/acylaminoacyl peptidase